LVCENEKILGHAGIEIDTRGHKFEHHSEYHWDRVKPFFPGDDFEGSQEE
jgi:hypothetical protein